jgi:hypothetical protein
VSREEQWAARRRGGPGPGREPRRIPDREPDREPRSGSERAVDRETDRAPARDSERGTGRKPRNEPERGSKKEPGREFESQPALVPERESERGLTLLESLLAWTLALAVFTASLGITAVLRRSFLRTEAAADAAQRVRIALESIARDLRMAGLGVDPDGAPGRPDEAIEGAWAGAIAARGDLDGAESSARSDPERWIAGAFPSVRTGNDELVVYALRRESGPGGGDLVFEADVAGAAPVTIPGGELVAPRDGGVEPVRLTRVVGADGSAAGAGCILYRATLSNNAAVWGTGNAVIWQPLADGIAAIRFRYFDETGTELAPPGGAEGARDARGRIASVRVGVTAIERRPDPDWTDRSDPDPATAHYRKAEGAEWIVLRSAGLLARADPPGGSSP